MLLLNAVLTGCWSRILGWILYMRELVFERSGDRFARPVQQGRCCDRQLFGFSLVPGEILQRHAVQLPPGGPLRKRRQDGLNLRNLPQTVDQLEQDRVKVASVRAAQAAQAAMRLALGLDPVAQSAELVHASDASSEENPAAILTRRR